MELKPYQQQVINDLTLFLEHIERTKHIPNAFHEFWAKHPRSPLHPFPGTAVEPYKNNIPNVPHVCVKVPTAGGKTFIACNALKPIFGAMDYDRPKAVVWLVPSITILDQTIKNLRDTTHPYRQKISVHFGNKVEVFDKAALLQGIGFNASSVREQLNIMVFSFDSLRARNKEDRKVFQENGNLQSFENMLGKDEEITLGAVIQHLNPLVIVDESHNAESELSVEMLKQLNPCFILDLTATPRKNSNIVSFIDALELKKENMVKLPVIVYNHQDKTDVIASSLQFRDKLEFLAKAEEKKTGAYIRPIVLFQAQPRNAEDSQTFEKIKQKLIEAKIPAEQIRIKTANVNEIKDENLMSRKCPVRYIITINALKEGWDCPFAYILASLSDKSSAVDVEQILGRILRQPYVQNHSEQLLNSSYVFTASSRFTATLENIVKSLNRAGFSEKDYRSASVQPVIPPAPTLFELQNIQTKQEEEQSASEEEEIDINRIIGIKPDQSGQETQKPAVAETIKNIEHFVQQQAADIQRQIAANERLNVVQIPSFLQSMVKSYTIKEGLRETASRIILPQFCWKIQTNTLFGMQEEIPVEKNNLLEDFRLSQEDVKINFDAVESELYIVDLDNDSKDHIPKYLKLDGRSRENLLSYITTSADKDVKIKTLVRRVTEMLDTRTFEAIKTTEITKYLTRIFEEFSEEQFKDFAERQYSYVDAIRNKISRLATQYAETTFSEYIDSDRVYLKPIFTFPKTVEPGSTSRSIAKSLYEKEGGMNGLEERMVNEIAAFPNIMFWTRNIEKKGFRINGFINHYPDFILHTARGKTIVVETKGDHLDADQKIKLGKLWANKAGNDFRYFMVYDQRQVQNADTMETFLRKIREL